MSMAYTDASTVSCRSKEIDPDVEMSTLIFLFSKQVNNDSNSDHDPAGLDSKPKTSNSFDLQSSNVHAALAAHLPPPSKYVRREKTSCYPPKGPSQIHVATETTNASVSGPTDAYDKMLVYLMNPCIKFSFQ
jgi:hypothetical protein